MENKKNEVTIQNEIKQFSKWELLKNNPEQLDLIKRLDEIEKLVPLTAQEYEAIQKELKEIQSKMNKFNTTFVKPLKRILNDWKNVELGGYEKRTVDKAKNLKKIKEQQAIDLELIILAKEETKVEIKQQEKNNIELVREMIMEQIEKLTKQQKWNKDNVLKFLNQIYAQLGK